MENGRYTHFVNIKPVYKTSQFINDFKAHYTSSDPSLLSKDGCQLLKIPFPCAAFENFLVPSDSSKDSNELLIQVESEVRQLPFHFRSNDMYTFSQSVDIANFEQQSDCSGGKFALLISLRHFLLSVILPWLEQLTGATLDKEKVDFTSSVYNTNDTLLCHDDELENRRIAFIWYLVPETWDVRSDGGSLDLFSTLSSTDDQFEPVPPIATGPSEPVYPWRIAASVAPRRNMFAFFEPSAFSFHQVSEVLGSQDRLSLHGWFHGTPHPRPFERVHPTPISRVSPIHIEEDLVYRWINPSYLDMSQQFKIRRRFLRKSEIQLVNFLKEEQWILACKALAVVPETSWVHCGPYNRKNYDALHDIGSNGDAVPDDLRALYRLLRSEAMLVILSDLTGIQLHSDALQSETFGEQIVSPPPSKRPNLTNGQRSSPFTPTLDQPTLSSTLTDPQFRRWNVGSYTMLSDSDVLDTNWRLESVLHLGGYGDHSNESSDSVSSSPWQTSWGGQLVYIAKDEKDELLTVLPANNALTLVYTGPGTANFVKYINHSAKPWPLDQTFNTKSAYDISAVYYDPTSNRNHEGEQDATSEDEEDKHLSASNSESDDDPSELSEGPMSPPNSPNPDK